MTDQMGLLITTHPITITIIHLIHLHHHFYLHPLITLPFIIAITIIIIS